MLRARVVIVSALLAGCADPPAAAIVDTQTQHEPPAVASREYTRIDVHVHLVGDAVDELLATPSHKRS